MTGIDVSRHNGTIDWQRVKSAGVESISDSSEDIGARLQYLPG